MNEQVD